jgi:GDPmannose 4,6-dehydratase
LARNVAFITGISGQDGSFLAEYLLGLDYIVHGLVRRLSVTENQSSRIDSVRNHPNLHLHYGDMMDEHSLYRIMRDTLPTEIYNLAAMSHVRISYDMPAFTIRTNGLGVLNVLEAYRTEMPGAKFYQASSSEMFGNSIDPDGCQRLTTTMRPVSPYGCAKVLGFNLTRHYRDAYQLFACNGILFNHESFRRGSNFVTNKVVKTAVQIKHGLATELVLGNLDSARDWGHSKDYVRAMHLILQHNEARDWIVATGQTRTVRELCDLVFRKLDMDYKQYVKTDPKFTRPEELKYLKGDSSETRKVLGWEPVISFDEMLTEMVDGWKDYYDAA